jgi:excisionase family DNA binding protein
MRNTTAKSKTALPPRRTRPEAVDRKGLDHLYAALLHSNTKLMAPSGEASILPESLSSFLVELAALLDQRHSVMIVRDQAQLTTADAASLLGVSRQFLVNLLEAGEIPHHMVGTHRRIYTEDLLHYKAGRDARRHQILRGLAQAEAAEGLYDRKPAAIDET